MELSTALERAPPPKPIVFPAFAFEDALMLRLLLRAPSIPEETMMTQHFSEALWLSIESRAPAFERLLQGLDPLRLPRRALFARPLDQTIAADAQIWRSQAELSCLNQSTRAAPERPRSFL